MTFNNEKLHDLQSEISAREETNVKMRTALAAAINAKNSFEEKRLRQAIKQNSKGIRKATRGIVQLQRTQRIIRQNRFDERANRLKRRLRR